jgi:hypothetical protein
MSPEVRYKSLNLLEQILHLIKAKRPRKGKETHGKIIHLSSLSLVSKPGGPFTFSWPFGFDHVVVAAVMPYGTIGT